MASHYKIGRNSNNGKLLRCANGKLSRGCCAGQTCPCCSAPQAFCAKACGHPASGGSYTPASVTVNISGIEVTDFPALWLQGIIEGTGWCGGHNAYVYEFSFSGSALSGSYTVPLEWKQHWDSSLGRWVYDACSGSVLVPFSGKLSQYCHWAL